MKSHYSMLIEWSVEDNAYVVSFQEFPGAHTHGSTYVDAVRNGQEVLDLLVETYQQEGRPLPEPALRQFAMAQNCDRPGATKC
jgi:predicted RNase H-like HicB family nuclease